PPSWPPLFPYTTLFRSNAQQAHHIQVDLVVRLGAFHIAPRQYRILVRAQAVRGLGVVSQFVAVGSVLFVGVAIAKGQNDVLDTKDRKSTRLNSSHVKIS